MLKKNLKIILISISIVTWFYGVTGILQIITKESKKLEVYLLLASISLAVLFLDDYSLSELHSSSANNAAAGVTPSMMHSY